ncbi:hypothetical protein GOP47_0005150 [Adiantum capillus-veneris]|uniref:AUGMIN subunit 4 n=1 Tax=Adiantum capillus-veneris TaxID=13818 RepID=A0A9D4V5G3_ADICA|nr:hypothetical protein GOP47_0005150 [Adiantum capillus-veneris]
MVKPILYPPIGQTLGPGLSNVLEQLERHCLAPDGSLISRSVFIELTKAREEMSRERLQYLEAMALYCEAMATVEDYQHVLSAANTGGMRDVQTLFNQLSLRSTKEVYECLEQRLVVAEAAQRLRLPHLSKDGELPEEDLDNGGLAVRTSVESAASSTRTSSGTTASSSGSNSLVNTLLTATNATEAGEAGVGGVINKFLGVTPSFLRQVHLSKSPFAQDSTSYQMALILELEARLRAKNDLLASSFVMDQSDSLGINPPKNLHLSERIKAAIEEIELEEAALVEDLYSADRKFAEYYNVLEQILGVLLRIVKDFKLQHQHQYDGLRKSWLCKRCQTMNAKLRVLEHLLLRDTYTQESIPALHMIREHLLEAKEEATAAYNRAVTRLREYQGVDPHFDAIARRYHDLVQKLEGIKWTIRQVEMDLNNPEEHLAM